AGAEGEAALREIEDDRAPDLAVHEVEDRAPLLDDRDPRAESRRHRGVLQPDDARPDDDGLPVHAVHALDLVGVEDRLAVHGDLRIVRGPRPASDQDEVGGQAPRALRTLHFQRVRIGEARGAVRDRDSGAFQLRAHEGALPLPDGLDAEAEIRYRDLLLDDVVAAVKGALPEAGEIEDALAQRLGRDRPAPQRRAAEMAGAVDHHDALADLGRRDGGLLSRRTRSDDREVVLRSLHGLYPSAPTGRAPEDGRSIPAARSPDVCAAGCPTASRSTIFKSFAKKASMTGTRSGVTKAAIVRPPICAWRIAFRSGPRGGRRREERDDRCAHGDQDGAQPQDPRVEEGL